jgi:superfamily II DNA or RNA helicase
MSGCSSISTTPNNWRVDVDSAWWAEGGESVQVVATEQLWGSEVSTVIVPSTSRVERLAATELRPLSERDWLPEEVAWRAASGLVRRAMADGEPLAVARGRVEPLPHQLAALTRAMATEPLRLLLADDVGLGKTIEAGLVITELKARGLVRRVLVIAPKGVQLQWVAEMADRFDEEFVLVGTGGVPVGAGIDPWKAFDQIVCSLDAVKPVRVRAGWTPERVAEHNNRRVEAIVEAGWDLVVIDEAHHVAGSNEDVARHALGRRLAESTPRVLLLSATPHSGKSDAFARLLGLLDRDFLHERPVLRQYVAPLVVRTEKRHAIDGSGRPLFRRRGTSLVTVPYRDRSVERCLYEAVTDYVRNGYRRALNERQSAVGFLVLLMQRLVSSSTAAILAALERRLLALTAEGEQLRLFGDRVTQWEDLTGEEQQAALAGARGAAWKDERGEVELLTDLARKAASAGIDAKARYLLDLLGRIAREEGDPDLKAVVFTEFLPTQEMLLDLFVGAGISTVAVNGSMSIGERREAQEEFRTDARVLVSTDAGGEGVNLQIAHVVINYDLPWSPTRIEQRIGRVDRIGQTHDVFAYNLALESSIDVRVLEVLERKLAVILSELGVDRSGDVIASVASRVDDLYTAAILDPTSIETTAELLGNRTRQEIEESASLREALPQSVMSSPVECQTGLRRWLELADAAQRRLAQAGRRTGWTLPEVLVSEPVPCVAGSASGGWTMWELSGGGDRTCVAFFVTDSGAIRPDIAERLWVSVAERPEPHSVAVLGHEMLRRLHATAADHAYRQPDGKIPSLILRLAIRVES